METATIKYITDPLGLVQASRMCFIVSRKKATLSNMQKQKPKQKIEPKLNKEGVPVTDEYCITGLVSARERLLSGLMFGEHRYLLPDFLPDNYLQLRINNSSDKKTNKAQKIVLNITTPDEKIKDKPTDNHDLMELFKDKPTDNYDLMSGFYNLNGSTSRINGAGGQVSAVP